MDKMLIDIIQQLHLFIGLGSFAADIIKEDGKCPDSQLIHRLELQNHRITVGLIPANILSRMNGPYEIQSVVARHTSHFPYFLCFLFRIRLPPMRRTVIRIVFRSVQIDIHLVGPIITKHPQMSFEIHGFPVITFHDSTERHIRIIRNLQLRDRRLLQQLLQRLKSVKCSTLVSAGNNNLMVSDPQIISFTLLRNPFPNRTDGAVTGFANN